MSGSDAYRDAPCANCGHRYGIHTLADCREMIPMHGAEKSCDCPGWSPRVPSTSEGEGA